MTDVASGGPPRREHPRTVPVDWSPLIDAARAAPGEWFHVDLPEGLNPGNVSGSLSFAIYKVVAEHAVRNGVVYLRFKESP